jgi:hypothetical protein
MVKKAAAICAKTFANRLAVFQQFAVVPVVEKTIESGQ